MTDLIAKNLTLFSWSILAIFIYLFIKGLREPTGDAKLIQDRATLRDWYGPEKEGGLETWEPLKSTRKGEYFLFHFIIVIDRKAQKKKAAAFINANDTARLKPGLKLRIKYQGLLTKKIAVADIIFDESSQET
ncbi:hypothetical protein PF050_10215 [Kosakonia pseudosacchari]|uniref:hypothetical protein n=1 Tax=Kosakonia pseudosacchari TaxID=1646340 RepID=UPI0022F120BC|nr:hypothetical protein [Kosakonia pseudosacchari]WBU51260.1 hypothetical protein PF050_10215 [Kosakonia pseudosacchari]